MKYTATIKSALVLVLLFTGFAYSSIAQTVTNNFEDGNWNYYSSLCWGIGPNNAAYYTKVTGNGFNGTDVCETDNLGQFSPCHLYSPWIDMNGNDNITFTHALTAFNGTRTLKVYLISSPSLSQELLWTFSYANGNQFSANIPHTKNGVYKIKWEWSGSDGNSRGQLDNIVIGGTYDSDPSNGCAPIVHPPIDSDNDGVTDNQDAYPSDYYRAFNNFYPGGDTATLAFEDLWPSYGDYDMNDVVVGYKFKVVSNAQHNVVDLFGYFTLKASGAGVSHGFGYQLPNVSPSSIISTTGYNILPTSNFNLGGNGTESGQSKATVIVFDDAKRLLSNGNTDPTKPAGDFAYFTVHSVFMNNGVPGAGGSVSLSSLNIQGYNPFIVASNDRGKEIHLPGYQPTSKMNSSYFGTHDDNSNPGTGKYYQSNTNLPWALDIQGGFAYPVEKSSIINAHTKFSTWAQSSGNQYPDWYQDKPGYRNNQNVY